MARKNFSLLKRDLNHPSLQFKKVGKYWSAHIGLNYRTLAVQDGSDFIWVWIGSHNQYDQMLN
ncbi:ParE family toxin-like protein [Spirulina major]|uniref:ParE family toxin-like protein n=1 Tax=Spirulina TaxID=1154 RepID=UPI003B518B61